MKRILIVFVLFTFVLTFAGCAGMSRTQQTTLSGAAVGAAGGGLLGAIAGRPLTGAAIGAGAGALGGYIVGEQGGGYYKHRRR
jgi:osmotically inducible lipoprotein OsmB